MGTGAEGRSLLPSRHWGVHNPPRISTVHPRTHLIEEELRGVGIGPAALSCDVIKALAARRLGGKQLVHKRHLGCNGRQVR